MKLKVLIPEKWSDIKLQHFQNYHSEMRKDINQATRLIQTIATLCDIRFLDAVKMKLKDVKSISKNLIKLMEVIPDSMVMVFEFKNIKYGFIPNLDEITIGEYADLEFYLSDKEKIWDNMHWIMSILYREVKEEKDGKYIIEKYEPSKDRAELFKDLSMNVVYSASNFFLSLGEELLTTMPNFIPKEEKKQMIKILKKMSGDGSELSTTSQGETSQNLKRLKENN